MRKGVKLGIIKRIDIKNTNPKTHNQKNRCAFFHFNKWFEEGNGVIARERLLNGKDIYEQPWFWRIKAAHNHKNI